MILLFERAPPPASLSAATGATVLDAPSEGETAQQERMKREG
jgi:hypothetical protein